MAKQFDFAEERRLRGRSLSSAARQLADLAQSLPETQGIDTKTLVSNASAKRLEQRRLLAERLQESVVPLFIDDVPPARIGSCVLVRLDSDFFAFTAAHVIREVGTSRLLVPTEAKGGKLLPLPQCTAHLRSRGGINDLDVAVIALPARELGCLEHHVFLSDSEIDQDDRPDDHGMASFYFVIGYAASRTQTKVDKAHLRIDQQSFHCSTGPIEPAEYLQEQLALANHIALDFDHKEIVIGGKRVSPPKLQGVSGGGIFQISRELNCGPLVAIATQHRRNSRMIVGTRIKHFLALARELKC
jgi:hypothetical protein